ncbi:MULTISPECIES: NAD-dependent epimerase/dehydratase family protein [unclassified Agromyces]|uniref:NAD-dependent epimerase/dehydratase family protein n=1 Tax=unclassified Agromyces TaxID=2639701 RepID=UPI0030148F4F
MGDIHVIFGTGPVGRATARALLDRGHEVRLVNRRGRSALDGTAEADALREVEVVAGDATDREVATRAARGAASVYQALNPTYDRWVAEFPAMQAGVLGAAEAVGARFVSMDNVYSYGRPNGRPLTERSPEQPHTTKGRLRKRMADEVWAAHAEGRVEAVSGRASDYYGPGGGEASPIGDRVLAAVVAGRRAMLLGDPDQVHSYTFIPDIGNALAELGTRDGVTGRAWHLPNDPEPWTSRAMAAEYFRLAGAEPRIGALPKIALRLAGLFDPVIREIIEMSYEFEEPFIVDSADIAALGLTATPIPEALAQTYEAYHAARPA